LPLTCAPTSALLPTPGAVTDARMPHLGPMKA
jgi:hypothetical protein